MRFAHAVFFFPCALFPSAGCHRDSVPEPAPVVWKVDNLEKIGGVAVEIHSGAPKVADDGEGGRAVRFDGVADGLIAPAVGIAGWEKFTIEADFFPEAGGGFEQRFIHMEDARGWPRALMEIRLNPDGSWYFDAYAGSSSARGERMALVDATKTHPSGRWFTVAMVYDGEKLSSYVDGVKEAEGALRLGVIERGKTSLGVRQNKVYWFKGMIREIRFYPSARAPSARR